MARRHYEHAPIIEAIIDLRAALPSGVDLGTIDGFADRLRDKFPVRKPMTSVTMGYSKTADQVEGKFTQGEHLVGLRLETKNGARVLQVQTSGFTYSHMPPYSDWGTFRDEARVLWDEYLDIVRPTHVTRLAVRVINKVGVPGNVGDLSRYSNLTLSLPSTLPPAQTFFTQFQISGACWAEGCRALVNAGAAPRSDTEMEVMLDFDIFIEGTTEATSANIWHTLTCLSDAKDDLFETIITDELRKVIA